LKLQITKPHQFIASLVCTLHYKTNGGTELKYFFSLFSTKCGYYICLYIYRYYKKWSLWQLCSPRFSCSWHGLSHRSIVYTI